MIEKPTDKQLKLANNLSIKIRNQTKRVLSAQIADELERKSFKYIEDHQLAQAQSVRYTGRRKDMPSKLVISTVAKNGYLYFKSTHKYCRPWDVQLL